jgi:S-formylglutathione hydrolase FrmB
MTRAIAMLAVAMTAGTATGIPTDAAGIPRAQDAEPRSHTIHTVRLMSAAYGMMRTFGLLLPRDYDQTTRRYPVLYLLHGSTQQHSTWGRPTLLDHTANAIVVMPDMDRTRYALADGSPERAAERFITSELVDYIDAHYRTLATRDSRAIAGLSIGGFGAMYLGLRHPDEFGAVGAFSAPYETGGDPMTWLPLDQVRTSPPQIYVGCGVDDSLLASSRRFSTWLQAHGLDRTYEEGPGAHTWNAWDWQLGSFLRELTN